MPEFLAQQDKTMGVIHGIAERFEKEIPKFSPRYIGHMFSEISMPALLGHFITLLHNPNNVARDASTVGIEIEREAIRELREMMGFGPGVGHFTSGGTVANFEYLVRTRERMALWMAVMLASGRFDNLARASTCGWSAFELESGAHDQARKFFCLDGVSETRRNIERAAPGGRLEPVLFVSGSKHYSWPKAMHLLGLGVSNLRYVELDRCGRATSGSLKAGILKAVLENRPILGVVAVAGTTELGSIDPIHEIRDVLAELKLTEGLDMWLHVDAAYGGFFRSLVLDGVEGSGLPESALRALDAISAADSVTLDPHKLGYVPYASGTFLCRNERDYFVRSFSGPYIEEDHHSLGSFTLEGSRAATGAVATYASLKAFEERHAYSRVLSRTLQVKRMLQDRLGSCGLDIYFPSGLDTNLVCFTVLNGARDLAGLNRRTLALYQAIQASKKYWISKTTLDREAYRNLILDFCERLNIAGGGTEGLMLLRLTLMNPFLVTRESETDHIESFCSLLKDTFGTLGIPGP